ncbi:MAG TPA: mechanosensitive ion channel domain-containing protein [Paracoccaceae bacterium]|nr:mechanosensitive ion channel domain-containing protein [Paracoccaceae bacterium]
MPAPSPDLEAYGRIESVSTGAFIDTATRQVDVFQQRLARILASVPTAGEEILSAMSRNAPDGEPTFFVGVAIFVAILLIIGRGGGMLFGAYVARPIIVGMQKPNPVGMMDKLPLLAARVGLTATAVLITLLLTVGLGTIFFDEHPPTLRTTVVILGAYTIGYLIDTTWRMVISPYLPNYRVPKLSDAEAVRLYRWISSATLVGVITIGFGAWLELMEVKPEVVAFLKIMLSAVTTLMLVLMAVQNHRAITNSILSGQSRREATWLAAAGSWLWAPLLIAYLLFGWLASSFRLIMGLPARSELAAAFAVFLVGIVVYAVTVYIVERVFARAHQIRAINEQAEAARRAEEAKTAIAPGTIAFAAYEGESGDLDSDADEESAGAAPVVPAAQAPRRPPAMPDELNLTPAPAVQATPPRRSMRSFEDLARRVASLFAIGVAAWLSLRIWVGREILEQGTIYNLALDVVDTAFIGYIIFHALRIWMDQKIAEEGVADVSAIPGDEGGGASAASRLGTLLPLIRTAVLLVVSVSVGLIMAARLGVNVAPLFAGAGIVGLAIGFGSQTLVRDILSGMFFLLDDAFRKGEYIDVGDVKGTVEKISLRSFQLRHHLGALNTIPFGEIKHLTNYSRDWVMMKLPLRVTYDTDVDKVRKAVKKLGEELLQHPTEGPKFIQPLKSQGVYMMEDSAMIIRVKYMTRPGDQWTTRKLVYQRIREVFEKEGIRFAHREVTVRIPDIDRGKELAPEEIHAIGAAARRVTDLAEEKALPKLAVGDDR